jgi:hypothetical protein
MKKICMSDCKDPENRNKWKTCACGFHSAKAKKRRKVKRDTIRLKGQGEELEGSFKKLADLLDGSEDRSPCPIKQMKGV